MKLSCLLIHLVLAVLSLGNPCVCVYIYICVVCVCVKNKPPRKALAENLGAFKPTCYVSLIFISYIYIDIDI